MSLYVRQYAWLITTPKMKSGNGAEQKLPSRIDEFTARGVDLPLPDLSAPHLFDWLMEVGPIEIDSMGRSQISWKTIRAWRLEAGVTLYPWQGRPLRKLSGQFLAESVAAEDWTRPAPWAREVTAEDRAANERQLRVAFGCD